MENPEGMGMPICRPWTRWPTAIPPQLSAARSVRPEQPLAVLLGCPRGNEARSRYGLFGIPTQVRAVGVATRSDLETLFAPPPPSCLRVVATGYEAGAPCVYLPPRQPPGDQPHALVMDFEAALWVDHQRNRYAVLGLDEPSWISAIPSSTGWGEEKKKPNWTLEPVVSDATHRERIVRLQAKIMAGDVYQANLARRLEIRGDVDALGLLSRLQKQDPVPHGAYLRSSNAEIVSHSMETLLHYDPETRVASSFPIKGTRRRGLNSNPERLAQSPKDRAEHVMIVDLVRNDLGRVCNPGTVRVRELMGIQGYAGVWHGVSKISATLSPDRTCAELMGSLFPGGSITGAPKRRAMKIIEELEEEARGFYTGSITLLSSRGYVSSSILIRTMVRDARGWHLAVGGGIVAESDPQSEVEETWDKVRVFRNP